MFDYILIFIVGLIFLFFTKKIAIKFNILDRPNTAVKTHIKSTPYLGGLGVILTFYFGILIMHDIHFETKHYIELTAIFALFILGLFDDIFNLSVLRRLFVELTIAIVLISVGDILIVTNNFYFDSIFTLIGIIFMINAMNILDILDGLSSGITIIILLNFILILLNYNNTTYITLSIIYIVSLLSFLVYNFNPASIFMGDSGSTVIGLFLAIVFINTYNESKELTHNLASIIALSIPIFELIYVSILRVKKGKNPMHGSKDHFALRIKTMGYTVKETVILSYMLTLLTLMVSYITFALNDSKALVIFLVVVFSFVVFGYILSKVKID